MDSNKNKFDTETEQLARDYIEILMNSPEYKKVTYKSRKKLLRGLVFAFYGHACLMLVLGLLGLHKPPYIFTDYYSVEVLIGFYYVINFLFVVCTHWLNETRSISAALTLLFLTSIFTTHAILWNLDYAPQLFFQQYGDDLLYWALGLPVISVSTVYLTVKMQKDKH